MCFLSADIQPSFFDFHQIHIKTYQSSRFQCQPWPSLATWSKTYRRKKFCIHSPLLQETPASLTSCSCKQRNMQLTFLHCNQCVAHLKSNHSHPKITGHTKKHDNRKPKPSNASGNPHNPTSFGSNSNKSHNLCPNSRTTQGGWCYWLHHQGWKSPTWRRRKCPNIPFRFGSTSSRCFHSRVGIPGKIDRMIQTKISPTLISLPLVLLPLLTFWPHGDRFLNQTSRSFVQNGAKMVQTTTQEVHKTMQWWWSAFKHHLPRLPLYEPCPILHPSLLTQ